MPNLVLEERRPRDAVWANRGANSTELYQRKEAVQNRRNHTTPRGTVNDLILPMAVLFETPNGVDEVKKRLAGKEPQMPGAELSGELWSALYSCRKI